MYKYLNALLRSNFFDSLPNFFSRKIFKIFKIFFVETKLNSLPVNNHPGNINYELQKKIIEDSSKKFYKPFNTCSYLLEFLTASFKSQKEIKFYDFGANNIDNYMYLNKNLKNLHYFYYDKPNFNKLIKKIIKENNLQNIFVDENFILDMPYLDFVFFGSSIQYISDYKEVLNKMFKKNPKFFIFSLTPFFDSDSSVKDKIVKQINMHPIINYAYLLNYKNFIDFMNLNNYKLISKNKNNLIKFLNFKNFDRSYKFIDVLDLIFARKITD